MISSDSKTNTFTEEGRILQVEYAIKNVSKAGTMIGLVCTDGVILFGMKRYVTATNKKEKIYKIGHNIYTAVAGISSDAHQLLKYARVQVANFKEKFDMNMPLKSLTKCIGRTKQSFTQQGGMRPFGVTFLHAGMVYDEYALFSTNPSGCISRWRAVAFGDLEDNINAAIKNELKGEYCLRDGTKEILRIMKNIKEIKEEDIKMLEILHFKSDKKEFLSEEDIVSYMN